MKEFMFLIRKQKNSKETLSPEQHEMFLKSCQRYIEKLKSEGRLISAQPMEWTGKIVSIAAKAWKEADFDSPHCEVVSGYYHLLANDLSDAISLAKDNPEFQFNPGTRIEVRPVKMKEETTGYVYPAT